MAQQMVMFCNKCYRDQMFIHGYKSHGMFGGGHEDWHCSVCGNGDYGPAQRR